MSLEKQQQKNTEQNKKQKKNLTSMLNLCGL